MSSSTDRTMWICGTCAGLYGNPGPPISPRSEYVQRCTCRRTDEPMWPGYRQNEHLRLCECCLMQVLESGRVFTQWFCPECKDRVIDLNDRLRVWLIPIGGHSMMVRTYDPPGTLLLDPEVLRLPEAEQAAVLERFRLRLRGWVDSIERLHRWSTSVLLHNLAELGFTPGVDVRVSEYMPAIRAGAAEDPRFGKPAAFERLEAHMRSAV